MCEINAYISDDTGESLYLESVESLKVEDGALVLRNLFGEEKRFEGTIREFSLKRGKIILRKSP